VRVVIARHALGAADSGFSMPVLGDYRAVASDEEIDPRSGPQPPTLAPVGHEGGPASPPGARQPWSRRTGPARRRLQSGPAPDCQHRGDAHGAPVDRSAMRIEIRAELDELRDAWDGAGGDIVRYSCVRTEMLIGGGTSWGEGIDACTQINLFWESGVARVAGFAVAADETTIAG